jgi:ubiquinone/menaquinone biosynthesis C-methylase UbiE
MKRPIRSRALPKPNYGMYEPRKVRRLLLAAACAILAGAFLPSFHAGDFHITLLGPTLLALGSLSLLLCFSMLAYSFWGRFNISKRMLGKVRWNGNETVLDIGTGRGLLAIAAAKRLRSGTVTAIDDWQAAGSGGDTLEAAQRNLDLARVHDRVELRSDDARDIAFVDNSFDVVLSLLHLHKIEDGAGRAKACSEIARVLKPGGLAVIADCAHVKDYARAFEAAGLKVDAPKSHLYEAFIALEIVTARKRGLSRS